MSVNEQIDQRHVSDRKEPNFDIDYKRGFQGELLVTDVMKSWADSGVEVKTDDRFQDTGNIFIEYECDKGRTGKYTPSGLSVTSAKYWVFVLPTIHGEWVSEDEWMGLTVSTGKLKRVCRRLLRDYGPTKGGEAGNCPTHGVLIRLHCLKGLAV